MRLLTPEIIIDEDDPFKNDRLNRKPFGESLMDLIMNIEDNIVLSLDGQWGDGKTTFVKMWQMLLEKNDIKTIYFDSFTNDYFEDPFIALVGNITSLLEKANPKKKQMKELKAKASKVGVQLLSLGARVGIKAATLGILKDTDIDQLKGIAGDIASSTSNFASKIIEEKLNTYKEDVDAIQEFKDKLQEIAEETFVKNKKPIVFIVDELDRCKPIYALNLMEKIKHLFSVKHIVFLLVMHKEQLEQSVRCLYGPNIDARTYLQKFINIECKLPRNVDDRFENDYNKYCRTLLELHELDTGDDPRYLQEYMELLARGLKFTLRDLQRCYTNLVLFYSATRNMFKGNDSLIALFAILKVKKPDLFEALKYRTLSLNDLWDKLGFDRIYFTQEDVHRIDILKRFLRVCLLPTAEFEKLDEKSDEKNIASRWNFNFGMSGRTEILPYLCKQFEAFKFPST